jgi:hypothetical protein
MKILHNSGYRGYLPVETLVLKGRTYDPFVLVPEFIKEIKMAMKAEFISR